MLTIVGLGPGNPNQLTLEAKEILLGAKELFLRTEHHPTIEALKSWGLQWTSFDSFYEESTTFDEVYRRIVETLSKHPDAVYAVPGNPLVAEDTVRRLLDTTPVKIVEGLSSLEVIYAAVGVDPSLGLQIVDGLRLTEQPLQPHIPCLVLQLYSKAMASDIKLELMRYYPDEHPVTLVARAGMPDQRVEEVPLYQIDRLEGIDPLTSLYLPAGPWRGVDRLADIVAYLRGPEGCPWDKEQTFGSLRRYILEEAYETVEAIESGDPNWLEEELGDLLLQVVLQSQLAQEEGLFDLADVAEGISDKLVHRHPHIFAQTGALKTAEEVKDRWEEIKRKEKGRSALDGVPTNLPALTQSEKLQRKAAKIGFDWPDLEGVFAKIEEEISELKEAIAGGKPEEKLHETGDVLLAVANLARKIKVDPEDALRQANRRFVARFQKMEEISERPLEGMTLDELEAIYQKAKRQLG